MDTMKADTRTCNVCRRNLPVGAFTRAFGVCEECHPVAWADLMAEVEMHRWVEQRLSRFDRAVLGDR